MSVETYIRHQLAIEAHLLISGCGGTGYRPDRAILHPSAYVALRTELAKRGYLSPYEHPAKLLAVEGLNIFVCNDLPVDTMVVGRAITIEYIATPEGS